MDEHRQARFPRGARVSLAELETDPHPVLRRLRDSEPVSWLPALGGWLVTRYDLALRVLRDPVTFTVDDLRFTTARVVGPSMLSLDGTEHDRHREPFAATFRRADVERRLGEFAEATARRLVGTVRPAGHAELRRAVAGPLAVAVMAEVLGLGEIESSDLLALYDAIVAGVSALAGTESDDGAHAAVSAAGRAFGALDARLRAVIGADGEHAASASVPGDPASGPAPLLALAAQHGRLRAPEVVSNSAVLLFGGIETTEGMITNLVWHLLSHPEQLAAAAASRGARLVSNPIDESLRLEPAAAIIDRYAAADAVLGGARIARGDLVSVSLAGVNRDPAVFADPDRFDVNRPNARRHLAFAHGSHFCLGAHLARLEARAALDAVLELPGLRPDPQQPSAPWGLVFRKPPALHVLWDA